MKRLIIAALVLVGCGTDQKEKGSNGDDSQEVIAEEKKESLENTFTVASLDDLPQCDEETEGRLGYVTHEEMLFSCEDSNWVEARVKPLPLNTVMIDRDLYYIGC